MTKFERQFQLSYFQVIFFICIMRDLPVNSDIYKKLVLTSWQVLSTVHCQVERRWLQVDAGSP